MGNFTAKTASGEEFGFHFGFKKPADTGVSALWKRSHSCVLVKYFSDNGKLVRSRYKIVEVSEVALKEKAGDVSWISDMLLIKFRNL